MRAHAADARAARDARRRRRLAHRATSTSRCPTARRCCPAPSLRGAAGRHRAAARARRAAASRRCSAPSPASGRSRDGKVACRTTRCSSRSGPTSRTARCATRWPIRSRPRDYTDDALAPGAGRRAAAATGAPAGRRGCLEPEALGRRAAAPGDRARAAEEAGAGCSPTKPPARSTSAAEQTLYAAAAARGIERRGGLVSIAHRPALEAFHTRRWEIAPAPAAQRAAFRCTRLRPGRRGRAALAPRDPQRRRADHDAADQRRLAGRVAEHQPAQRRRPRPGPGT